MEIESRKYLRGLIASTLEDISDLARTRLAWDAKIPGVIRTYEEDVYTFLGYLFADKDLQWGVTIDLITPKEANELTEFFNALSKFDEDNLDIDEFEVDITLMPEWKNVAIIAKKTLEKIGAQLRS